jgi:hypothetical protein
MSTRSRDIPKKPVISGQKLKSRIGHVQRAETGLQSKKSKKANDSPLQNIFKFDVKQSKKIWLFYLHVRGYFLHIGVSYAEFPNFEHPQNIENERKKCICWGFPRDPT